MYTDFNYETLLSNDNPDLFVIIANHTKKWSVTAFLQEGISLQGNNDWSNAVGHGKELGMLNSGIDTANSIAGRMGHGFSQGQIRNLTSSVQSWTNSTAFTLNLDLIFIKLKETDDIIAYTKILYDTTYPSFDSPGQTALSNAARLPQVILAPGGYSKDNISSPQGALSVTIGRWFKCINMLVADSYIPSFSKEITKDGTPLYIKVKLALRPFRMISVAEMQRFFKSGSPFGSQNSQFVPNTALSTGIN